MDIIKTRQSDILDIALYGKFTFSDHIEFRSVINEIHESSDISEIAFHMSQLEFVDSSALGMLLLARDEAEKSKKRLSIVGATGQVKKMFMLARFDQYFRMA